ncbi:hypothetical protein [Streptomyces scopuliridis]|uniref:hypothetical protein n=1 Tax=Streptomyces scopuliridis TaxID=452529 RepID=UPI00343E00B8
MKIYERTENGVTTRVTVREGLDEIDHAMMAGKRDVRTMSSITRTDFAIEYKDGRSVRLVQVDAPAPEGYTQGQAVVVRRPGQAPLTGTVAHIHTAPGCVAVLDDRHRGVSNYPTSFVSAAETVDSAEADDDAQEWGTASASMLLHKFQGEGPAVQGADYRAKCRKNIRWYARPLSQTEGPRLRSRTEIESSGYANLYTFCPKCKEK